MNPLLATLRMLLDDKSLPVDPQWVDEMSAAYPYMTLPATLELERSEAMSDERKALLMRRVALNSPSSEILYRLSEPLGPTLDGFYPDAPATPPPSTEKAIDTFMDRYGVADAREEEILEKLIFNPVADYAQILASEEEKSLPDSSDADGDSQDSLISAFILKSRNLEGHFPSPDDPIEPDAAQNAVAPEQTEPIQAPAVQDDSLLSESLAKIYIKQHRYAKAFEIISNLSLKYPKKSIYFADQLRFLQKLIINQQYKNKK